MAAVEGEQGERPGRLEHLSKERQSTQYFVEMRTEERWELEEREEEDA
jgi:hypothetical protein